jgi:hypothetical protein
VLEKEAGASFSYPYLMRSSDGMIRMAYTRKGKVIALSSFNEEWIASQEAQEATGNQGGTP